MAAATPRCARRRRWTRWLRWPRRERLEPERRRARWPTPTGCCAPIEHRVQMIDDAQTHTRAGRPRRARPGGAAPRPRGRGRAARPAAAPRRARRGPVRRACAGDQRAAVERPRHPARRAADDRLQRPGDGRAAHRRPALGPRAIAALAGRADRVRGDAARPAAPRSPPVPTRSMRSTASATSSSGCRAGSTSTGCSRRGPSWPLLLAKILAHAPALSDQLARRPELLEGLFDASSFDPPPSAEEFAAQPRRRDARPAVRRRARPRPAAGQRAPLRARGPADRPAQATRWRSRRAIRGSPKARCWPWPTRRCASSRASTAGSPAASWSSSASAGSAAAR